MKKLFLLLCLSVTIQSVAFSQDLFIFSIDGAKSVKRYAPLTLSITFKNTGTVNITKSTLTDIYLSTDNKYSANDYHLGDIGLGAINFEQSRTISFSSSAGSTMTLPTGNYYLIANVDKGKVVAETNETNNLFVSGGYVIENPDIDFFFTSFRIDRVTASPHGEIHIAYTTADKSATRAYGGIPFTFYLSHDQIIDGGDFVVDTRYSYITAAGNKMMSGIDDKLIVPGSVAPGSYYVIAKMNSLANGNWTIQEADMTNNTAVSELITIVESNIDLDFSGQPWNALTDETDGTAKLYLVFSIHNGGTTSVSGHQYTVYTVQSFLPGAPRYNLTANAMYQKCQPQVILAGQTIQQSIEIEVHPSDPILSASFGLLVKVNESGNITETNYSNNELMFTMGLAFRGESYDPTIVNFSVGDDFFNTIEDIDKEIPFRIEYRNSSAQEVNHYDSYTAEIRDVNRDFVTTGTFSPYVLIPPGQTVSINTSVQLFKTLPVGTYTLEISNWRFPGFALSTVFNVVSPRYTFSGSIEGEDGVPITNGNLVLYKKNSEGVVNVTHQSSLASYSNFNLTIGGGDYALYFVPDETEFGGYVPTVMTKSLILTPTSFVHVAANKAVTFQVLKTHPVEGSKFIDGNIMEEESLPAGKSAASTTKMMTVDRVTVVLFSENGEIVAYTKSDETGYYKFENLSSGNYQVLPIFPFGELQPQAPTNVDLTRLNAQVDFIIEPGSVTATIKEILLKQTLSFTAFPATKYKNEPLKLEATTDSSLPITYLSSNPFVAEIVGENVVINGVGEVTITAVQTGDETYQPASKQQVLVIEKADQAILFDPLPTKTYNDDPFALSAISDSGLPVMYTSSNEELAEFIEDTLVIKGVGEVTITANQIGNDQYHATSTQQVLIIEKDDQTITFDALSSGTYNDAPFALTAFTDSGLPVIYVSSNEAVAKIEEGMLFIKGAGEAVITALQPGNDLYRAAESREQTFFVAKATQSISFEALPIQLIGAIITLPVNSSSGLPVAYTLDTHAIAAIEGNVVTILGSGETKITATQVGNSNYEPAPSVAQVLQVEIVLGTEDKIVVLTVGPNPTTGKLKIVTALPIRSVSVTDMSGRHRSLSLHEGELDIRSFDPGIYLLTIETPNNIKIFKIIKV